MHTVALAPCSPFSVTGGLLRESAVLARSLGVRLHTHLAETKDEEAFTLEHYGMRPLAYMESLGWIGDDVWYAHGIHFNTEELELLAATGTGVAHCPVSNMKLSSLSFSLLICCSSVSHSAIRLPIVSTGCWTSCTVGA